MLASSSPSQLSMADCVFKLNHPRRCHINIHFLNLLNNPVCGLLENSISDWHALTRIQSSGDRRESALNVRNSVVAYAYTCEWAFRFKWFFIIKFLLTWNSLNLLEARKYVIYCKLKLGPGVFSSFFPYTLNTIQSPSSSKVKHMQFILLVSNKPWPPSRHCHQLRSSNKFKEVPANGIRFSSVDRWLPLRRRRWWRFFSGGKPRMYFLLPGEEVMGASRASSSTKNPSSSCYPFYNDRRQFPPWSQQTPRWLAEKVGIFSPTTKGSRGERTDVGQQKSWILSVFSMCKLFRIFCPTR